MEQWQTENRSGSFNSLRYEGAASGGREGLISNPVKESGPQRYVRVREKPRAARKDDIEGTVQGMWFLFRYRNQEGG